MLDLFSVLYASYLLVTPVQGSVAAYQAQQARSELATAEQVARAIGDDIGAYYLLNKRIPADLKQAGYSKPLPDMIDSVQIRERDGILRVNMKDERFAGGGLIFNPSLTEGGSIQWRCSGVRLPWYWLPASCQAYRPATQPGAATP
ncbi:hypothetical protein C4K68_27685 [Pokkaliibacter plantistimulans]|uniref:Prepilin-type cleavage/methylation domain-containing protein n=1 Tax=Proteobacteria bacterium 228 TaxID=2083153 RepID=A0A2S5KH93_9PROT|nr:hypothetical protein [Pokkaliibacter plantistimulans]PPC74187.1 hypothetical protein C4K68_27685 [Pokkaliibacter plantistimulans]